MIEFQSQFQKMFKEVTCSFNEIEVNGTLVHSALALCVSPQLLRTGQIPFQFKIPEIDFIYESAFTSCKFILILHS